MRFSYYIGYSVSDVRFSRYEINSYNISWWTGLWPRPCVFYEINKCKFILGAMYFNRFGVGNQKSNLLSLTILDTDDASPERKRMRKELPSSATNDVSSSTKSGTQGKS